ncbi:hypothetical protein ACJX0J_012064, partial [Zea mays]
YCALYVWSFLFKLIYLDIHYKKTKTPRILVQNIIRPKPTELTKTLNGQYNNFIYVYGFSLFIFFHFFCPKILHHVFYHYLTGFWFLVEVGDDGSNVSSLSTSGGCNDSNEQSYNVFTKKL